MRRLIIGAMLFALCGTIAVAQSIQPLHNNTAAGDPATATLDVGLSVVKYAEVAWNQPSATFSATWGDGGDATVSDPQLNLLGPVGWQLGINELEVPLRVRSNCAVILTLHEGLTEGLMGAHVPAENLWGTPEYKTHGDSSYMAYKSELAILRDRTQYSSDDFTPKYADTSLDSGWWQELPDNSGHGLASGMNLGYGNAVPNGGAEVYTGDLEAFVLIGTQTYENTSGTFNWTELEPGSIGSVLYYATVSVPDYE